MRTDQFYPSKGAGQIHVCRWIPEGKPSAIIQIVHGIAEYAKRYDDFANYLNGLGYLVVAEDHMGHGESVNGDGIQGYFHGGWFTAVADTYTLLERTRGEYPNLPYVLLGHSMGSFMTRTLLSVYPNSGISAAIICGTGWQPKPTLSIGSAMCSTVCITKGDTLPSKELENLVFGTYNKRVEHPRTAYDWLCRDAKIVDAYLADPMCGFVASAGLLRDMLQGIHFIEERKNLAAMKKELPVFFIAGGDDPVGNYGKGVRRAAEAFRQTGMKDVSCKIYPLGRHEILNEINKQEVYSDISTWLNRKLFL